MRLEYQIVIALLLDLALGDPRWLPHPVRLIGRLIAALDEALTIIPESAFGAKGDLTPFAPTLGTGFIPFSPKRSP